MRRFGWSISALIHLLLLAVFLIVHVTIEERPPAYSVLSLLEVPPEEPAEVEPAPEETPARPDAIVDEGAPVAGETGGQPESRISSNVGVREGISWVTGPPEPEPLPIDLEGRTRSALGVLHRALAEGAADYGLERPEATVIDTLLFAQQRLIEIGQSVMEAAREGALSDRMRRPMPEPGTIDDLRGEPMLTLPPAALLGAILEELTELGRKAWDRLTGRDRDEADPFNNLDLTEPEIMAYAALDDNLPLNIFEWYARLHPEYEGGLSRLQQLAAQLADHHLIKLELEEDVFRYRRTVPLRDVVRSYTAWLNRLPDFEVERKLELIRKLSILVREPY